MRKRGRFEAPPAPRPSWKTTNRHLQMMVTSAVSMLLCCTMLLGTTMAWFTDTITSSLNQITIGTLGIALYEGATTNAEARLNDGDTLFSGSGDASNTTKAKSSYSWGPDYYQTKVLTVENTGDLELIFELRLLSGNSEVISAAQDFEVYVRTENVDQVANLDNPIPIPTEPQDVLDAKYGWDSKGNLGEILTGKTPVFDQLLAPADSTSGQSKQSFAIALRMTSADNSTQGSSLTLDIQLFAYQSNATGVEAPSTTQKTAVIYEVDNSEDTEELKSSPALNSVLKSTSVNSNQVTNGTENSANQNVTNDDTSANDDDSNAEIPESDITDGEDDDAQLPDSGTTGDDDGAQVPESGTTGGDDDGAQVPESGTTGGDGDGAQVPESGTTGGDGDGAQVPDSDTTGGDDDSAQVTSSDTTGDDASTPEPNSDGQNGSETDSSQGTDSTTTE